MKSAALTAISWSAPQRRRREMVLKSAARTAISWSAPQRRRREMVQ